jgi:MerR family copper efflux transcriptional regulator
MIRYYESMGLLPSVARTEAGYRLYGDNEVHTLHFISRARNLGFGIDEIAELLKLWSPSERRCQTHRSGPHRRR